MPVREEALLARIAYSNPFIWTSFLCCDKLQNRLRGICITIQQTVDMSTGLAPAEEGDFSRMRKMEKNREKERERKKGGNQKDNESHYPL